MAQIPLFIFDIIDSLVASRYMNARSVVYYEDIKKQIEDSGYNFQSEWMNFEKDYTNKGWSVYYNEQEQFYIFRKLTLKFN